MQHGRSISNQAHPTFPSERGGYRIARLTSLVICLITGLTLQSAQARELQGRLGVGYNSEFAQGAVPSISLKYALARDLGTELVVGVDTASPTSTVAAVKFSKGLFFETNLNFNAFAGLGMVNAHSNSGVECLAGFGLEFFIPGIESVGFSTDTGVSLGTGSGSFALRTLGVSFLNAGIHFYF
jgi:hypothetical protein